MNTPILPEAVRLCLDALEKHGFACYAVGGCVRDSILGLSPHDFDLCTAATPDQMKQVFHDRRLVLAGEKHGTVAVVTETGPVEITTFRTEGGYEDNRHPDWVRFVPNIEDDLARRDFTVNAMAWSPCRGFADPFGGQADLKNRILRAVGQPEIRFREDSLRILRGVRFSVRYTLTPEKYTMDAMVALAPLMDNLAKERIFDELCKLLPLVKPEDLLRFAPVLTAVIPELKPMLGFDQRNPHHVYDLFTHTAHVTGAVPPKLTLRWAALLHDIGKVPCFSLDEKGMGHFYGHAQTGAQMADTILRRLKAPSALREQVVFLIDKHMSPLEPDKKLLRRRVSRYGMEAVRLLLQLQQADFSSKGTDGEEDSFGQIRGMLDEIEAENTCLTIRDLAVNGHDLMELGLKGPVIGTCLEHLLSQVLDEAIPNKKQPLLDAARHYVPREE